MVIDDNDEKVERAIKAGMLAVLPMPAGTKLCATWESCAPKG